MKRLIILGALAVAAVAVAVPAYAVNNAPGQKISSRTTLDACGYFSGTQTANKSTSSTSASGIVTTTEKGTWTGVNNDGTGGVTTTPVASLGSVTGSYTQTTSYDPATGVTTGTETFRSDAGQISQTFAYGGNTPGGFNVAVTATGNLSFLTSNTNGACYTGAFPRP